MATRRRGQRKGRAKRRRQGPRRFRKAARAVAALLLLGSVALGFSTARYLLQSDALVRARFEGATFRVPSRVLAAPTILYPGIDWRHIDLRGALARLGYRPAPSAQALAPGRYHWSDTKVSIHRRAFEHPSRAAPARQVQLELAGERIERLHDAPSGRELSVFFLEPEQIGSYYGPAHEQRELVKLDEVPAHLVEAVIAVEDQRFLTHAGLDPPRILGALFANLRSGEIEQGGSTLTQQLAKNFFLTPERTFRRKVQEAVMALIIEARYSKLRILETYLNEIYFGQRGGVAIHGVGEAARLHFGKRAQDLGLHESALLAAIIQSPNGLSPHRRPEAAQQRRDLVLQLMHEQGRISDIALARALSQPLQVAKVTPEPREARYFLDALRRQLPEFYDQASLSSEGLRLYSTLDLRLQRLASRALREELERLEGEHPALRPQTPDGEALQGCLIALRPQTGEVLALVGGRDYATNQYDHCTQARRSTGSVFKTFVYVAALEPREGRRPAAAAGGVKTLADWLDDSKLVVPLRRGNWEPRNFDREFHGRVPLRVALEKSYNVATARLGQEVGIERVADVARRLGITSPLPVVPSLAIGAADLSPLEVARAYATLANGGIRPRIRTFEDIVDPRGETVERQAIDFERVLDAGTAYLAVSLLEGVVERGTAASLRRRGIEGPLAGKTGTSNDEKDAWFVGFMPELVVAVWVGFDTPRSLGLASSRVALPIWARFVREATGGVVPGAFPRPRTVIERQVHPQTGALALAGCPARRSELFVIGAEPAHTCPDWGAAPAQSVPPPPERRPGLLRDLFDDWFGG